MKVPDLISDTFPIRPSDSNKYSVGTVTIVGGCGRFLHAPSICGLGARAAGAGLIHLVVPDAARIAAGALVPEATFMKQTATCVPPKADSMVIGIGLGVTQTSEMLVSRLLSGSKGNFVLDADALTILSNWYAQKQENLPVTDGQTLILTPHAGEAARLLACKSADILNDRISAAKRIVERYHAICVLKGANTIVASPDGRTYLCEAGNPFMAMGGMGDLLSGVIAARWAYIKDPFLAACSSVWLHASASDALVNAQPPVDPSIVNTAAKIGSLRVALELASKEQR
ncbi:MAG: NAD(P)H-hydrate dehydratase [Kiritimatiellae bacterium]|nr:NAD(P)H-hydrate dehydratase [Kiritimatiellia bacterium]